MLGTRKDSVSTGKVSEAHFRARPIARPQIELNASDSLTFRENTDDNKLYRNRPQNIPLNSIYKEILFKGEKKGK